MKKILIALGVVPVMIFTLSACAAVVVEEPSTDNHETAEEVTSPNIVEQEFTANHLAPGEQHVQHVAFSDGMNAFCNAHSNGLVEIGEFECSWAFDDTASAETVESDSPVTVKASSTPSTKGHELSATKVSFPATKAVTYCVSLGYVAENHSYAEDCINVIPSNMKIINKDGEEQIVTNW